MTDPTPQPTLPDPVRQQAEQITEDLTPGCVVSTLMVRTLQHRIVAALQQAQTEAREAERERIINLISHYAPGGPDA